MNQTKKGKYFRYLFVTLMIIVVSAPSKAQSCIHQISVGAFGTNLTGGDIHPQWGTLFEGTYTRNMTHRWAWSVSAAYVKYNGDDEKSSLAVEKRRGLRYKTEFFETSAGVDMTFIPYAFEKTKAIAPFLGFSVGCTVRSSHKPKNGLWDAAIQAYDKSLCSTVVTVVPKVNVSLGVKSKISTHLALEIRATAVYYYSDDMDFSSPKAKYLQPNVPVSDKIVGASGYDWGMAIGLKISYLWGQQDCHCQ